MGQHPSIEIVLRPSPIGRQYPGDLDSHEIDLALAPNPAELLDRFAATPLFTEELVIIAGRRHQLPALGAVNLISAPAVARAPRVSFLIAGVELATDSTGMTTW